MVDDVIIVSDQICNNFDFPKSEVLGQLYITSILGLTGKWMQTSIDSSFRKNFASVNYFYDEDKDAFIPPRPFDSWGLNADTCNWEAPIPKPIGEGKYAWNETDQTWNLDI